MSELPFASSFFITTEQMWMKFGIWVSTMKMDKYFNFGLKKANTIYDTYKAQIKFNVNRSLKKF